MTDIVQAVLWLIAGCAMLCWIYPFLVASYVQRRNPADEDQSRSGPGKLAKGINENVVSGSVLVIRLTDDGELCRRSELADATYAIRHHKEGQPSEPVLAVWYVHGWRHSAKGGDSDLHNFRKLITKLKELHDKPGVTVRHAVGIYVGWNAALGPGRP
jgi:hypothetical protein